MGRLCKRWCSFNGRLFPLLANEGKHLLCRRLSLRIAALAKFEVGGLGTGLANKPSARFAVKLIQRWLRLTTPQYVALCPPTLRDKILSALPGMTDLASIEYRNEGELLAKATDPEREYRDAVLSAKLKLSAAYIDQVSLEFDLKVMLLTVTAVWLSQVQSW